MTRLNKHSITVDDVQRYRLTPKDLEGKPYKLSVFRALYILLGLVMFIGGPIYFFAAGSFSVALILTGGLWFVMFQGILNVREAICEHIVGNWCAKEGYSKLELINHEQEIISAMSSLVRRAFLVCKSLRD